MNAQRQLNSGVWATKPDWVVLTLLAVSLLTNVLLGVGFMRLAMRSPPSATMRAETPSGPSVGDTLPPIDAKRLGSGRERVSFASDGRPTLVYVFAPTCGWCARNENNALALFSRVKDTHRVVALSLAAYAGDSVKRFPGHVAVYLEPAAELYGPYHLGATPATLVVSPSGRVLKSWLGAYGGTVQKEVEAYFRLRLPGLVPRDVAKRDNWR